jgi:RNA polymerase sigma-70 factor (ECF subfamily)
LKIVPRDEPLPVDEDRVIERVLSGDADAYGYFVRAYQRRVYGTALRLLHDGGEAECVAQEAFVRAYRALAEFRGGSRFETWVTRIAINVCRDRLKRKRLVLYFHQRAAPAEGDGAEDLRLPASDPSPERLVHAREIKARLREAIDALSPRQRIVFVLKHFEERSTPEIAELLGLDSGTVKAHLFRASTKVRARMTDFRGTP